MGAEGPSHPEAQPDLDVDQIIEIRDPEIDVEALMAQVRANVARRRAEGAYREDLDAITREVFDQVVSAEPPDEMVAATGGSAALTLAELESHWMVREQPFVSQAPIVGRLIVAVRNFWNWMSTKWYVRPIVQQQVGFNFLAVRAFRELAQEHEWLASQLNQLTELCERQERELGWLREEVERLQALGQAEDTPEDGEAF